MVCSRDIEGNIYCANCKLLILSKNITDGNEQDEIINKFESEGVVYRIVVTVANSTGIVRIAVSLLLLMKLELIEFVAMPL